MQTVRPGRRQSGPLFDGGCRVAERSLRRLEREDRRADPADAVAATAAWTVTRLEYRDLLLYGGGWLLLGENLRSNFRLSGSFMVHGRCLNRSVGRSKCRSHP